MAAMPRYLRLWVILTVILLLAVASLNLIVDPYGIFRLVDTRGFNRVKPMAGTRGPMAKAIQVLRVRPQGLVLGNSRAEVGFDPENRVWPAQARPVYNLSLPGTGTSTTLRYLQHVLASGRSKPQMVVWGIDFMDFLVDARMPQRTRAAGPEDGRLLANPDGAKNPVHTLQLVRDYTNATFSLEAFLDSIETIASQNNPFAANLTPLGFNPMHDYLKITAEEGYWAVFRQRDIENIKAYLRRPKDIYDANGRSSPALDDLREILSSAVSTASP